MTVKRVPAADVAKYLAMGWRHVAEPRPGPPPDEGVLMMGEHEPRDQPDISPEEIILLGEFAYGGAADAEQRKPFSDLAQWVLANVPAGNLRYVCLLRLAEAQDCALHGIMLARHAERRASG